MNSTNPGMQTGKTKSARYVQALYLAAISFLAYVSVYGFRKPFTVAEFTGVKYWGISYQTLLIISQVIGYMLSKFYGIVLISSMKKTGRWKLFAGLISVAWACLFLLAIVPQPWGMLCMLVNGYMLGFMWGFVFSYIEGRRTTDLIASALAVSFIFAGGFTRSVAKWLLIDLHVSQQWMPFLAGAFFVPPLALLIYLLERAPLPDEEDIADRSERLPMTKDDRRNLIKTYGAGLIFILVTYVLLTIIRDVRDSFMSNMWGELGHSGDYAIFTRTETITSVTVLAMLCLMMFIRDNMRAFRLTHILILAGLLIAGISSYLFRNGQLGGVAWMQLTSLGLYMSYIPYNCIFFERMIAALRLKGNVGFLIYLVDAFGYMGSLTVMLTKEGLGSGMKWTPFYSGAVVLFSLIGVGGILFSYFYFDRKYRSAQVSVHG
jgi:hypothetical protein